MILYVVKVSNVEMCKKYTPVEYPVKSIVNVSLALILELVMIFPSFELNMYNKSSDALMFNKLVVGLGYIEIKLEFISSKPSEQSVTVIVGAEIKSQISFTGAGSFCFLMNWKKGMIKLLT
jgi:hypothetical protein